MPDHSERTTPGSAACSRAAFHEAMSMRCDECGYQPGPATAAQKAHNLFFHRRRLRWTVRCSACGWSERLRPNAWIPPWGCAARESIQHDCAVSGHLYDDDWPWPDQDDMRALAPGSRVGDPCIWCDHEKAAGEVDLCAGQPREGLL